MGAARSGHCRPSPRCRGSAVAPFTIASRPSTYHCHEPSWRRRHPWLPSRARSVWARPTARPCVVPSGGHSCPRLHAGSPVENSPLLARPQRRRGWQNSKRPPKLRGLRPLPRCGRARSARYGPARRASRGCTSQAQRGQDHPEDRRNHAGRCDPTDRPQRSAHGEASHHFAIAGHNHHYGHWVSAACAEVSMLVRPVGSMLEL